MRSRMLFSGRVWFLLTSVFIVHLASYMVIPFMMVILPRDSGISLGVASVIVFMAKVSVKLSNLFGGPLADRFGTKSVMAVGLLLRGIGMAGFFMDKQVWWLLLSAAVAGIGNGFYSPPTRAALSFLTPSSEQSQVFSARSVAANLGMALAPVVTFLSVRGSSGWIFLCSGALFILFAIITSTYLPEFPGQERTSVLKAIPKFTKDRTWIGFCIILLGSWFMYGQIDTNVVVLVNGTFGFSGAIMTSAGFAFCVVVCQLIETRIKFARRLSPYQYVLGGTVLLSIGLLTIGSVHSLLGIVLCVIFFGSGATLLAPGQDLVTAERATSGLASTYYATASLSSSIGTALSAPLGAFVTLHLSNSTLPWVLLAATGLGTAILLIWWGRRTDIRSMSKSVYDMETPVR
jgi:MFS family permease